MSTPARDANPAPIPPFVAEIDILIRARYPALYLVTWEEHRLEVVLGELADRHRKDLYEWSIARGITRLKGRGSPPTTDTRDPLEALKAIEQITEPSLVVLKDFHPYLTDPNIVRVVRELAHRLKSTYTTLVFLSPVLTMPPELEKELTVIDIPLPTFRDLAQLLREIVDVVSKNKRAAISLSREQAEQLIRAASGLTLSEAENAFAKAIATDDRLDANDIRRIHDEKRQVIRKSGLLEYYSPEESLGDVGGLDLLKRWLARRGAAFSEAARKFGLPEPRGLLMLGVQGCGKSLTAKAIASAWRLPLLRLDMGRIFSGLVGSSEENLRKAIKVAEGVSPVILWVDEIEKGLAGSGGSSTADSGVSARVFGTFLTWLQEKKSPVFVVATANRIDALPPELLRKGRFDEIFFIDLPLVPERKEIFRIHLSRRKRAPANYDLDTLAAASAGFSGAEIEQAVISGLYDAFADGTELTQDHLLTAMRETVPLSTLMKDDIDRLRNWAKQRTRPAHSETVPEPVP